MENRDNIIISSDNDIHEPSRRRLLHAPTFKWVDWIYQLVFIVIPGIAVPPLYLFSLHSLEEPAGNIRVLTLLILAVVFAIAVAVFAIIQAAKGVGSPPLFYALVSVGYITWIMFSLALTERFLAISQKNLWLILFAAAMIPVFFSMIKIIRWLSEDNQGGAYRKDIISLVLVPLVWYLFVNTIIYSARGMLAIIVLILTIIATYFFIFLLLRILYLVGKTSPKIWNIVKILLIFVLPILCFVVTQTGNTFSFFWDYTSPLYYLLVVINGLLLIMPEPKKAGLSLLLFLVRCVVYLIVTYFFVVISPFYSLSLVGLMMAGIGLLVLSPLLLWAYQTRFLLNKAKDLADSLGLAKVVLAGVAGLAVVPILMFSMFTIEKINFQKAVNHVDNILSSSQTSANVNNGMIKKTIQYLGAEQRSSVGLGQISDSLRYGYPIGENRIPPPFITVLHNRVLDADNILLNAKNDIDLYDLHTLFVNESVDTHAEEYFYDDPYEELIPDEWIEQQQEVDYDILIDKVSVDTKKEADYYRSVVNLELKNTLDEDLQEYSTFIELPVGVFVSDYYLDVYAERKEGLLVETTSAQWIYDVVTSRFLDPGLISYFRGGITLNVFPFSAGEVRRTGIEFLHKEPVSLEIDGKIVKLGEGQAPATDPVRSGNLIFVSTAAKERLVDVKRDPFYVFAVDCSYKSDVKSHIEALESFVKKNNIPPNRASISAINYNMNTWSLDDNWQAELLKFPTEGGFGYGLMLPRLFEAVSSDHYPVLIVLENEGSSALLPTDSEQLNWYTPETKGYYKISNDKLTFYDFELGEPTPLEEIAPPNMVKSLKLDDRQYYLLADTPAEILQLSDSTGISPLTGNRWEDAFNLTGDYAYMETLSEEEPSFQAMLEIIKKSFSAKILSRYTSYIVLELPEQEQAMYSRQELLLQSTSWEDFRDKSEGLSFTGEEEDDSQEPGLPDGEDPAMSEPSLIVSLPLLAVIAVVYKKKRKRKA